MRFSLGQIGSWGESQERGKTRRSNCVASPPTQQELLRLAAIHRSFKVASSLTNIVVCYGRDLLRACIGNVQWRFN